jgi:hypothetical protein
MKQWVRDLASVKWNRGKYSQSYQDILLERIFEHIGVRNTPPFCVEFGFNDTSLTGGSGSNVANFVLHHGWQCLLLDGGHANPSINLHQHLLTAANICDVFAEHGVPPEPEYISIDVDSTDLWLFRSLLTRYKAMIYTVEYNSCFPLDRAITFPDDATERWQGDRGYGASLKALQMVAAEGGYSLLWVVRPLDAVFIRDDLIEDGSGDLTFPLSRWKHATSFNHHLRLKDASRNDLFLDYETYVQSHGDMAASRRSARDVARKSLLEDPWSMNHFIRLARRSVDFLRGCSCG